MGGTCSTNGGRKGMHIGFDGKARRDQWEDQDVGGWTILKSNLEK
jgi:hypothetical protein